MRRFAAALIGLLFAPQIALAARDVSASIWTVYGDDVVLSYTFPKALAAQLAASDTRSSPTQVLARYIFAKVSVQRKGKSCEAVDQGYDLGRIDTRYVGPGVLSFEILFRCAGNSGTLVLRNDAFFDRSAGQIGIANVWLADMPPVSRLVTKGNTAISVAGMQAPEPGGAGAWIGLGLRHVFASVACLCMALGLLLLLSSRTELFASICGLVAGYLLAASAAGAGGWSLQAASAQVFGGFLILFIGALLAARGSGRPNAVAIGLAAAVGVAAAIIALLGHGSAALCLAGAGTFGVLVFPLQRWSVMARGLPLALGVLVGALDGFSLASMFEPLHAVVSVGAADLFAYNGGALLGFLAVFAAAALLWLLLRRCAGFLRAPVYRDLLTASLAAVGVFSMLVT